MLISPELLLTLSLIAAGLAMWGVIAARASRGVPICPSVNDPPPVWNAGVVTIAAALWAIQAGMLVYREWLLLTDVPATSPEIESVQNGVLYNALLVAVLLFLLSGFGRDSMVPFGVRGDRWREDLAAGSAGFLAAMPAVFGISLLLLPLKSEDRTHGLFRLLHDNPALQTYLWVALQVIVAAPLFEELLFRVILQGALRSKLNAAASIGLSSVAFAFVHGFPDSLALLPLALVLGFVFERRRSWLAVVVLHGLFNASMLAIYLLGRTEAAATVLPR